VETLISVMVTANKPCSELNAY